MNLYDQVLHAIHSRQPFTLYPFRVGAYNPEGDVIHTMDEVEAGKIGYLMQWWAKLAIYKPKTMSFNWDGNVLQIIYRANATTKADQGDGPSPVVPDPSSHPPSGGGGRDN